MFIGKLSTALQKCYYQVRHIISIAAGISVLSQSTAYAQIVPDTTLLNNSQVTRINNINRIEGGTQAEGNLFHSFTQFSILTGDIAYFNNGLDIQNIFSRVTGKEASNLDGLIRANGSANLFLINPNGIIFGKNASLDIGGSFVATTANAIEFGQSGIYSATNPQAPSLLKVNPSAFLFNQFTPTGSIQNASVAPAGIDPAGYNAIGLRVPNGKSLMLVGGNVIMDGGELNAYGGRVELGGLAEPGKIALQIDDNNFKLGIPKDVTLGDISLDNRARVYVEASEGGNITFNARNIDILGRSLLSAGIGEDLGSVDNQAEDITLQATGKINITQSSRIENNVNTGATGNAGNINIITNSLSLTDNSELSTSTFGKGNAGNLLVRAKDSVSLTDTSTIFSSVRAGAEGTGGNIDINAASLSILRGAQLIAGIYGASENKKAGQGNSGDINIKVSDAIVIDGKNYGLASAIFNDTGNGIIGNGGNITIDSNFLSLTNGARINTSTSGKGSAGNVTVSAKDSVFLADRSNIISSVNAGAEGTGGNIDINAGSLFILRGAQLIAGIYGASENNKAGQGNSGDINIKVADAVVIDGEKDGLASAIFNDTENRTIGNAGNITIDSNSFFLTNGARINSSTEGKGDAGNVTITAKDSVSVANSRITTAIETGAKGKGGNININGTSVSLSDNTQINSSTSGRGNAGNVTLQASNSISLADANIFSTVEVGGVGKGGNIDINAPSVLFTDTAQLATSTEGEGNAGNVKIFASDAVSLVYADIYSNILAGGIGKGGNININASSLSLQDGANIQTLVSAASDNRPAGRGDAGNVNIDVSGVVKIYGEKNDYYSSIYSDIRMGAIGNGGNITINAGSFFLTDGAQLSASMRGEGKAGNININALGSVLLSNGNIFSNIESGGIGQGGNININAASLSIKDSAQLQTAVLEASEGKPGGKGNAGSVNIDVKGAVTIAGSIGESRSAIYSEAKTGTIGNGGNISITSGSLSLIDNAIIDASTSGKGDAGNITIRASDFVSLVKSDIISRIKASGNGNAGKIDINTASLSLNEGAQLQTLVSPALDDKPPGQGDAGDINIDVTGAVNISGAIDIYPSAILSRVEAGAIGNGGNITINSGSFALNDGNTLETNTRGQGNAGNLTLRAKDSVLFTGSYVSNAVEAGGIGRGGNIDINAAKLSILNGAQVQTLVRGAMGDKSAGQGDAGNIDINITDAVNISGRKNGINSGIISLAGTGTTGNGGDININSGSFSLSDKAIINTSTSRTGNAGNVTVYTDNFVSLVDADIFSKVEAGGIGRGGNIDIKGASLSLLNGSILRTSVNAASDILPPGQGSAGNININVTGSLNIAGIKNESISGIASQLEIGTIGSGGNIDITSGSFSLTNSILLASTYGKGNAGNVTVNAKDFVSLARGSIFSTVEENAVGKGGNIDINTPSLSMSKGAEMSTSLSGGQGEAGNVTVRATGAVSLTDRGTRISSTVEPGGLGNGGKIDINANSLSLDNGSELITLVRQADAAELSAVGNAGDLNINVNGAVTIFGGDNEFLSWISSRVEPGTIGNAGNINITSDSFLLTGGAQLSSSTFRQGSAGNVNIQANNSVSIIGSNIFSTVGAGGVGNGGNIDINAATLSLLEGGQLLTFVSETSENRQPGQGNAGSVNIKVKDKVTIAGNRDKRPSVIGSSIGLDAVGNGGNVDIYSKYFSLANGGFINTSTLGEGDAGAININSTDNVSISGVNLTSLFSSGLLTETFFNGKGGNITITSPRFQIADGAILNARTIGDGVAGNITVNTNSFEALNGGQLVTTTLGSGSAGKITINSTDRVLISGSDTTYNERKAAFPLLVRNVSPDSGLFVFSESSGTAGNIKVTSPKLTLDNRGKLIAESASGNGGNIDLDVSNLLLMQRGAQISTTAGTALSGGDGGNININSRFIVAVPQENNDITANAYEGNGGRIQINTQGIFGLEARATESDKTSDITASSSLGVSGTVSIQSLDNSTIRNNLTELQKDAINTDALIANSCIARSPKKDGTFTITGAQALPLRSGNTFSSQYTTNTVRSIQNTSQAWKKGAQIIEPTGVYRLANGTLVMSRQCE